MILKLFGNKGKIECCQCGAAEGLEFTPCPYASEINNDYEPNWYCNNCLINNSMDI